MSRSCFAAYRFVSVAMPQMSGASLSPPLHCESRVAALNGAGQQAFPTFSTALVDIGSRTYWFTTANAPAGQTDESGELKAELIRRFGDQHAPISAMLKATPDSAILRNDVYYLDPLERWSPGHVVLLATRPTRPPRELAGAQPNHRGRSRARRR